MRILLFIQSLVILILNGIPVNQRRHGCGVQGLGRDREFTRVGVNISALNKYLQHMYKHGILNGGGGEYKRHFLVPGVLPPPPPL